MNTDDPIEPAQYDVLRAALRDEAAPAPARESAVAAALAVFDDLQSAAAPAVAPAPVIPLRRRNWWTVGLSAAAAAAVVLFIALGMIRPNASNVALSDAPPTTSPADLAVGARSADVVAPDSAPLAGAAPVSFGTAPTVGAASQSPAGGPVAVDSVEDVKALLGDAANEPDTALETTTTDPSCLGNRQVIVPLTYQGAAAVLVGNQDGSLTVIRVDTCAALTEAFRLES